jgi:TIR domain
MRVFISHQQGDSNLAQETASILSTFDIESYLDVIDDSFKGVSDISEKVTNEIKDSTHVLIIVSDENRNSFWVPWEAGVATALNKAITTLSVKGAKTHEFLEKWPVLRTVRDFEAYMFAIRETQRQLD